MTYSADTPILSTGQVSVEAIQAWFTHVARVRHGAAARPVPPDLGAALGAECRRYPQHVVNHDLAAAQVLHETDAWQSRYAQERNNPGGIGAVNHDPDQALWFPTVRAGLQAHVAHLLVYALGAGPWVAADPRADAVFARGWGGAAETWRGLNGRWAWPGTSYGQTLARLANELTDFAENGSWNMPVTRLTPVEIVRRILPRDASNTPQRVMDWQYLTVHNTGNPRAGADALMHAAYLEGLAWTGASEPSWGYTVDDTRIVQHLEDDQAGWHASDGTGDGNLASIGIELVEVGDQERVLRNAAWLIAGKLHGRGWGVDRLRQHHDWARDKKNCPRLLRANGGAGWQRLQVLVQTELDALSAPPVPPTVPPAPPPATPDPWRGTNPYGEHWIVDPFLRLVEGEGFPVFGYVLGGAFLEDGKTVQYFERARLELHADGAVTRGLVGREVYEARYPGRLVLR